MGVIYEPTGAAREYADLALNLYSGCEHGCIYCYAPNATFKNREVFHNKVHLKDNIIKRLEKDLKNITKKNKFEKKLVLMSFTCDPYQPAEETNGVTRDAIQLLNDHEFPTRILTKGGDLSQRDMDLLSQFPGNEFGVSLTLLDKDDQLKWEPKAAEPMQRIENLKVAKGMGIKTWLSLEPIIDIDQAIEVINETQEFTDHYGVGKLNYNSHQKTINWVSARERIIAKFEELEKDHTIHATLLDA
jgi:DNA repair photolyase